MSPAKLPVEVEEMYGGGCMMALMCRLFRSVMEILRRLCVCMVELSTNLWLVS